MATFLRQRRACSSLPRRPQVQVHAQEQMSFTSRSRALTCTANSNRFHGFCDVLCAEFGLHSTCAITSTPQEVKHHRVRVLMARRYSYINLLPPIDVPQAGPPLSRLSFHSNIRLVYSIFFALGFFPSKFHAFQHSRSGRVHFYPKPLFLTTSLRD